MSPPAPASVCEQGGLQEGVTLGEPGEQRGVTRSWGGSWGPVVMVWGLLRTRRERCHCRVLLSQLCKEHPRGTGKGRGGDVASGRAHGEGSPAESTEGASPALCRARQACGTAPANAFFFLTAPMHGWQLLPPLLRLQRQARTSPPSHSPRDTAGHFSPGTLAGVWGQTPQTSPGRKPAPHARAR